MKRLIIYCLFFAGCAGLSRRCSSYTAENFGGDWIVVQYRMDGTILKCWKMQNVSIVNEEHSDGVYWKTPTGHLVHVSGWYNRVQVQSGDWAGAATDLGIDLAQCSSR